VTEPARDGFTRTARLLAFDRPRSSPPAGERPVDSRVRAFHDFGKQAHEWEVARSIRNSVAPNGERSAEWTLVQKSFPASQELDLAMTILPLAGVILLALWLVETIIFLVGYRQMNSNSS